MKNFNELSLREKLIRVMVTIAAIVLLPAACLIIIVDFFLLRDAIVRGLTTLGDAVAYNASAALAFDDREDAARVLQAFQSEPNVKQAVLYDMEGKVFSLYRSNAEFRSELPDVARDWPIVRGSELIELLPVSEAGSQLGWLLIRYDLSGQQKRLVLYLLFTFGMTGLALVAAYFLSVFFQRRISAPILDLENVARKISQSHDYTVRATKQSNDEIGSLTETFNDMLEQIDSKEAALRRSEERLRAAVEASGTGVWDWDVRSGEAAWIGSIFTKLANAPAFSQDRLESILGVIHPDDRSYLEEKVRLAIKNKTSFDADFRVCSPRGEIHNIRARGQTFTDSTGEVTRMIGAIIDITDLRTAQAEILKLNRNLEAHVHERTLELQQALNEIESFNYSVSHDLRTPLRSINGFSQALLEDYYDQLDDTARNFLERIVASCKKMGQLIDDLLKLSRITKHEIRKERLDLSAMAREILQRFQEENPKRQAEIHIEDGLYAVGDPHLISVALENILQNAWKFSSKKDVTRIAVGRTVEDGKEVFFIRDNGAGFDMAFAERLFGVFQRLHKSSEFEGTGIGLATVHRVVERHGGRIWAASELDRGATFYFILPPDDQADEP